VHIPTSVNGLDRDACRVHGLRCCASLAGATFEPNSRLRKPAQLALESDGCSSLPRVLFDPDSVRIKIVQNPFHSCESLKSVDLPPNLEILESDAFSEHRALSSVTFGLCSELRNHGLIARKCNSL
jgi:hypothetical protein